MKVTLHFKKVGLAAAILFAGNLGLTEAAPATATEVKVINLPAPNGKKLGILGALGSCFSFLGTLTIIPFIPTPGLRLPADFPPWPSTELFL